VGVRGQVVRLLVPGFAGFASVSVGLCPSVAFYGQMV
jgi:hypothetical protein